MIPFFDAKRIHTAFLSRPKKKLSAASMQRSVRLCFCFLSREKNVPKVIACRKSVPSLAFFRVVPTYDHPTAVTLAARARLPLLGVPSPRTAFIRPSWDHGQALRKKVPSRILSDFSSYGAHQLFGPKFRPLLARACGRSLSIPCSVSLLLYVFLFHVSVAAPATAVRERLPSVTSQYLPVSFPFQLLRPVAWFLPPCCHCCLLCQHRVWPRNWRLLFTFLLPPAQLSLAPFKHRLGEVLEQPHAAISIRTSCWRHGPVFCCRLFWLTIIFFAFRDQTCFQWWLYTWIDPRRIARTFEQHCFGMQRLR